MESSLFGGILVTFFSTALHPPNQLNYEKAVNLAYIYTFLLSARVSRKVRNYKGNSLNCIIPGFSLK